MAIHGKKYKKSVEKIDSTMKYTLEQGVKLVKESHYVNFDESVDLAVRLGVDPKQSDQMVRGTVVLPHGTGKTFKVLVFAKGEKEKEARDAGADYVGAEDFITKISQGWMEFDKVIATPDMMGMVSKLGKILGPRGLMPNPKVGTVTFDLARAIKEVKGGKVEFKIEKAGIIQVPVGRISFSEEKLVENASILLDVIVKAKPASSKGTYIRSISLSSTMGPGVRIDPNTVKGSVAVH